MTPDTAILIVNGGREPHGWSWLQLCLNQVFRYTPPGSYRLYVWNGHPPNHRSVEGLTARPDLRLFQQEPGEQFEHPHAGPLQRLYQAALEEGARFIVTLDSDAHPLRHGWLSQLTGSLEGDCVLAGVWRDELHRAIEPYIHPSGLAVRVDFIASEGLRFDRMPISGRNGIQDTLSHFTRTARKLGLNVHPLGRSNKRNLHRVIGGLYGDLIYHHGAGSRRQVTFWDEEKTPQRLRRNRDIALEAEVLLHRHYDAYIGWLRGINTKGDADFECRIRRLQTLAETGEGQT